MESFKTVLLLLLLVAPCCWTQTPTQYVMQKPSILVLENVGTASVCISRTGDDTSSSQNVFLTTMDDSAVGGQDFGSLSSFAFAFGPNQLNKCLGVVITDDTTREFKEKFTVTIVGASDGIPGSQPSTVITIEENDYCTAVPFTNSGETFYVTPWTPTAGQPIVFQNTAQVANTMTFIFSTSANSLDNSYEIVLKEGSNTGASRFTPVRNGVLGLDIPITDGDFILGNSMDTIEISFDPTTGTFSFMYSGDPSDVRIFTDATMPYLAIRHVFASVGDAAVTNPVTFSICSGAQPGTATKLSATGANQSGTSTMFATAVAANVIDGNRNRMDMSGTCSVTGNVEDPWIRVDLGKEYEVSAVNIFPVGMADSGGLDDNNIANAAVYVGSCDQTYITDLTPCNSAPGDIISDRATMGRFPTYIECTQSNTYGRYVYVRLETAPGVMSALAICEIEVFGTQIPFGNEATILISDASAVTITETDMTVPVTVELTGPGATCGSVVIYTEDGTATSTDPNADFTAIPQAMTRTLTFVPDTKMQMVDITINDDTMCEEQQSFKVRLSNNIPGLLGASEKTITITDDDMIQYFIENAGSGFEITEGGEPIMLTIRRTANANIVQEVRNVGFVSEEVGNVITQTLEFKATEMTTMASVNTRDDNVFEADTTFTVRLQTQDQCSSLVPNGGEAIVTVKDDDSRFYFDNNDLDDGKIIIPENAGTVRINVRREGTMNRKTVDISIQKSENGDSALSGTDFTLVTSPVVFEAGRNEAYATISIEDDNIRESNERFDLVLSDPENIPGNIKEPYRVTVEIVDDDAVYRFESTYYSVFEAQRTVEICLERDGSLTQPKTIVLEIRDQTTTANQDYTIPSTGITVFFAQSMSRACQSIQINADSIIEGTETLLISIPSGVVDTDYDSHASLDILDDRDVLISFSSQEYTASEGDEKATVYVNKHGDLQQTVYVDIATTSITADEDDYVSVIDSIRIPAGQATASYEVRIIDDSKDESNEQFRVTLSNAGGGVISNQGDVAVVTILDNDDQINDMPETNNLSDAALGGIIAGAVVATIISALGIGLFGLYMVQRGRAPMIQARPAPPMTTYQAGYGRGTFDGPPYRQPVYPGGQRGIYYS